MTSLGSMRLGVLAIFVVVFAGCSAPAAETVEVSTPESLLWSQAYPRLEVTIHYALDRHPADLAISEFEAVLERETAKEEIVVREPVVIEGFVPADNQEWNFKTLAEFHRQHFAPLPHGPADGTARLHVVYMSGAFVDETNGVHGRKNGLSMGSEIYLFPDGFRDQGSITPLTPEKVERQVLIHELGHAFGLVNCGIPMVRPHEDDEGCHSSNPRSVMVSSADSAQLDAVLDLAQEGEHIPFEFDANDLADLAAFRSAEHVG